MIEIQQPELEALIYRRLHEGPYKSVEEVLMQALNDAPLPGKSSVQKLSGLTGADIIAVFQRSPHRDIELEQDRPAVRISDPVEF